MPKNMSTYLVEKLLYQGNEVNRQFHLALVHVQATGFRFPEEPPVGVMIFAVG